MLTTFLSAVLVSGGSASGDSIWTESGNDVFFANNDNGLYVNTEEPNSVNLVGYNGTTFNDIWLRGGNTPNTGVGVMADGSVKIPNAVNSTGTYSNVSTGGVPNMYIAPDGTFYRSTASFYSTEEVDKMLTIKDKLIEKLSARLDSLEKKVK